MFKVTYKEIRNEQTLNAMQKLSNCPNLPHKVAYNVMRMSKVLDQELRKSQQEWGKLADKIIVKEITPDTQVTKYKFENGAPVFVEGVTDEDGRKQIEEYNAKEVIIERFKLKLDDLEQAHLTPAEMYAIEFMISE